MLGNINDALSLAKTGQVQNVYIALPMQAQRRINQILDAFSDSTVNTYIVPDFLLLIYCTHVGTRLVMSTRLAF